MGVMGVWMGGKGGVEWIGEAGGELGEMIGWDGMGWDGKENKLRNGKKKNKKMTGEF